MLAQIVGHFQFGSLQNTEELQGVDDGLALVVVVGDDVGVAGVFLNFLDTRDPGFEFVKRIKVVVAFVGGEFGIIAEPCVIAAAVKSHVADRRSALRGWRDGIADDRLIDVAEACVVLVQEIESVLSLPGRVAKFDDEGIVGEAFQKGGKMGGGFWCAMKGKRELEKHRAKLACFAQHVEAGADVALVFGRGRGFVGEALPEFGGEDERGICRYAFDPGGGVVRADGLIEGSIDLDGVEKPGEESCFVKVF